MIRLLTHVLLTVALFTSCMCNDPNNDYSAVKEVEETDLQNATDAELEQMCTSRGFELVKEADDETGHPKQYSHDDYIDAARQCLEIEAEMEQILGENPQLLDDIETEAQKMREEKDRLEKELAEAKLKLRIEQQTVDERNAFVNKSTESNDETFPEKDEHTASDEDNEIIDLDLRADKEGHTINVPVSENDSTQLGKEESSSGKEKSILGKEELLSETDATFAEDSIVEETTKVPIMTLKEFVQEFRDKIKNDVSSVVDMVLPAHLRAPLMDTLKPAIRISKNTAATAFNLLKRYVLIMLGNVAERNDNEVTGEQASSKTVQT